MTSELRWDDRPDDLRDPILLFAFSGWNDAGEAASGALAAIAEELDAQHIASIDPEGFYDFQVSRPTIDLAAEAGSDLEWPEVKIALARPQDGGRDLVLLAGSEPSYRWRGFSELVVGVAQELGAELMIGFGALLADVAHTRDVRLTGIARPRALVEGLGFREPTYRGPTGIVGVLHAAAGAAGIDAASLWAPVPHYLSGAPNPKGALALVKALQDVGGLAIPSTRLEEAVERYEREVSAAVERDPEAEAMVRQLEQAADDADLEFDSGNIPSGDALADEIQGFLRRQESDGPDS